MIRRFLNYIRKVYHFDRLSQQAGDGRSEPEIASQALWQSLAVLFALRLGSGNALEQLIRDPSKRAAWKHRLGDGPPSADCVSYYTERLSVASLRQALKSVYQNLQRNHHLARTRLGGWSVLVLDAHELFASYQVHCEACCQRRIHTKRGDRIQYYHPVVVAYRFTARRVVVLDVELQQAGEDEVATALRLLERIQQQYPKAYDVLCGDAQYLDPRILAFLRAHRKHLVATLKEDHPALLAEVRALCELVSPSLHQQGKRHCLWWDLPLVTSGTTAQQGLRVVRSLETYPQQGQLCTSEWVWATTFSSSEASTEQTWNFGHHRWDIENRVYNYLVTYYGFDHNFHHHPNAILVFVLMACLIYMLVSLFYHLNCKAPLRDRFNLTTVSRQFLIGLDSWLTAPEPNALPP